MKCFIILIAAFALSAVSSASFLGRKSCDCVCGVRGRNNRIVGGKETAPAEFPWIVGFQRQGKLYCSGSLITDRHVLTAAHCVDSFEPFELKVLVGGHNITQDYKELHRVRRITAHRDFDIFTFNNDVAVVELDKPVNFGPNIQTACLPSGEETDFEGRLTVIAGWGRVAESKPVSQTLRSVIVPVWGQEDCLSSGYGEKRITENMMCAGYHDGAKDACQGDSGGPMVMEGQSGSMEVIGLVSWGRGCARPNLPGVYTRIVNYLPWIKRQLGGSCLCHPRDGSRKNVLENIMSEDYDIYDNQFY